MNPGRAERWFERVAALAVRRPWATLLVALVLAAGGLAAALSLETNAGTETLVDEDSPEFTATESFREDFGDEAAVVLVREDLRQLMLTKDLGRLLELEACLAGGTEIAATLPIEQQRPLPEVCDEIAELAPSRSVFGPATFLYQAVVSIQQTLQGQIGSANEAAKAAGDRARREAEQAGASEEEAEQAAEQAAQSVLQAFQGELIQLALEYEITRPPRLDDTEFVSRVVFDPASPGEPKQRLAPLFPNRDSAVVSVRLRPDLSDAERAEAVELFERAAEDERFALSEGDYLVSGVPAVVSGLADALRSELFVLLAAAALVMAVVLALILRPPLRLLPLCVALAAAALTFGALALVGGELTMASIAVLPVLIGLAVDYAIQLQARFAEARREGNAPGRAATIAAARGGPIIGAACLATAAGFAALWLSPIPMVRSFGLLLVVGIALAFTVAATAGFAALALAAWRGEGEPVAPRTGLGRRYRSLRERVWARVRGAGKAALAVAITNPGRVLAAALILAVCGWIAGARQEVVSDIRDLAPSSLGALEDINELQDETGVSGEVDVVVRAEDLTDPAVIGWMRDFQTRVLERNGFGGENPSCREAELCPAVSLTEFFPADAAGDTQARARSLLEAIPPYFSQAVITRDPETGEIGNTANIAFGIRVQPLTDQQELIEGIREEIDPADAPGPPAGTEVELAGLPVIAAEANSDLDRSRYWLPLVGLAAVALALFAVYRSARRALVPLIPIALATGWSALVVASMGVALNPMSATLGALVIAIATEFSVILAARYQRERDQGLSVGEGLRRTYSRTGAAVLASGVTALAGFAALAATDIRMLRDFGLVTVADLAVALAGVLLVLPAALVWAEEGFRLPAWLRSDRPRPARGPVGPGALR